ncbi:MAG: phosphoheptose isomerase [Proteobacteria bacterium]|nr:MAG: phosphoheptose isomerase [Pseudomonadota bacterium]PIE67432.1 MAG: phosphoheptose isomerase [Deltaproteobacteria bacterium]
MLNTMLDDHIRCLESIREQAPLLRQAGEALLSCLAEGGKILVCGNGGSAGDAQHFAAEIVGRFEIERGAFPAIALSTDTSILTAVGNDYGYDAVFARQVEALGRPGDMLVGISTSGNSQNVIRAAIRAASLKLSTMGLLGNDGGALAGQVERAIVVKSRSTARIQEAHIFILHYWAKLLDRGLLPKEAE